MDWGLPTAVALQQCRRTVPHLPLIASGGVRDVADITKLRAAPAPIFGCILGRALYDGDIVAGAAILAASA